MKTVVASLAAASLLLAACTTTPESTSTPQPTTTTVAPVTETPTPTPTPTPDELAPIRAALQRYFDARDTLFHDPTKVDPNLIPSIAIGQAARGLDQSVRFLREDGNRVEGRFVQRNLVVSKPVTRGDITTSVASYCEDNSTTTLIDSAGQPVQREPDTFPTTTTLTRQSNNTWIVSEVMNEVAPC